jgi:hypothetical protein
MAFILSAGCRDQLGGIIGPLCLAGRHQSRYARIARRTGRQRRGGAIMNGSLYRKLAHGHAAGGATDGLHLYSGHDLAPRCGQSTAAPRANVR